MKNILGKSAIATVAVVLAKVLLGGVVLVYGNKTLTIGAMDATLAGALLTPVFAAYVSSLHKSMDPEDDPVQKKDDSPTAAK